MNFGNTNPGLTFGSTQPATNLGLAAPISSASQFQTTSTTQSTQPTTGFSIPATSTVNSTFGVAAPATTAGTTATLSSVPTTTLSSVPANTNQLNFCQLEELINKWTLELEEQEKIFMNQATQVNSWDNMLISNSNKIMSINDAVEKVKIEQQALEQELEFISAQHSELDDCIKPLQEEFTKSTHIDVEKAQTYILAENLDTQLRQMSEDLKEVIEHLNEANKNDNANDDPIVQIGLILNAHMSSLQWIESSASQITAQIDNVSKMHDSLKRDNEKTFRLTYND
ncbi:hypothetical protein HA402_004849 [Bradysia odoriphaga]|nr:hypothetical protein HA402_004849 [Bradysia odoriphaga]